MIADRMIFGHKDSSTRFILITSPCHCLVSHLIKKKHIIAKAMTQEDIFTYA